VLHELLVQLPAEDFVYFGDTARFPYGVRPPEELERFALEIADRLLGGGAKLLVVACNAAASSALPALRERLGREPGDVHLLAVVEPESRLALAATRSGRIGLLATPTTVSTGSYAAALQRARPGVSLTSVACPDLAPIIQGGFPFDESVVETVRSYCRPLREAAVDTVILGCTHYPLLGPMLQRILGPDVRLVFSGAAVAAEARGLLDGAGLLNPRSGEGRYRFECSGDVEAFRRLGTCFLQMPLGEVTCVPAPAAVAA